MGDPINEIKSAESDSGADQSIKDATHETIESCRLETLRREADRLLNLIEEADLPTKSLQKNQPTGQFSTAMS